VDEVFVVLSKLRDVLTKREKYVKSGQTFRRESLLKLIYLRETAFLMNEYYRLMTTSLEFENTFTTIWSLALASIRLRLRRRNRLPMISMPKITKNKKLLNNKLKQTLFKEKIENQYTIIINVIIKAMITNTEKAQIV
jgi:hypothetical protein